MKEKHYCLDCLVEAGLPRSEYMSWRKCSVCGGEKYCHALSECLATPARTREDVERLKADWLNDPCYDIEATAGFEAFYAELKAFSVEKKQEWALEREEERRQHAEKIARSMNTPLSLRDFFAMSALEGMLASETEEDFGTATSNARIAYEHADAMLLERLKESRP